MDGADTHWSVSSGRVGGLGSGVVSACIPVAADSVEPVVEHGFGLGWVVAVGLPGLEERGPNIRDVDRHRWPRASMHSISHANAAVHELYVLEQYGHVGTSGVSASMLHLPAHTKAPVRVYRFRGFTSVWLTPN